MGNEGQYRSAITDLGPVCSDVVIAKVPSETRELTFQFDRDLVSGETLSSISGTPTGAPTGGTHLSIDSSAVSGTLAQLVVSGGVGGNAFSADGDTDVFTATSHGLVDGDTIHLIQDGADGLPGGVDEQTMYYVVSGTSDTFKVALTAGGDAVELSADGQGVAFVDYVLTVKVTTSESQILECKAICACRD